MTSQIPEMSHIFADKRGNEIMIVPISSGTSTTYTMFEIVAPPGAGVPPLRHTEQDMAFYVLEGAFTFQRADTTQLLNLDEVIFVRQGITHCFTNTSAVPGRLLVITSGGDAPAQFSEEMPLTFPSFA